MPGEESLKKLLGTLPGKVTAKPAPPFPGSDAFGPGKNNAHITALGNQLVKKGFGKHYVSGAGPKWSDADRKNVRDFQLSRCVQCMRGLHPVLSGQGGLGRWTGSGTVMAPPQVRTMRPLRLPSQRSRDLHGWHSTQKSPFSTSIT
ncbi:peptidoglycan-binding protein [Streptomyces sp. NPDC049915]|uniref:peptidoglycan-binding protein n=1 Tax=Streptomyces sp. NPDC049915 TaxID=3155510 RepID=UPI003433A2CA